jgi:hypothetical protein
MSKDRYEQGKETWKSVERPGYFGKRRGELEEKWNSEYGEDNWRLVWETADGRILGYEDIIAAYTQGYIKYFRSHPDEADFVTENFAYAYDKDMQSKREAFDIYALYNKPGKANQFHHVAMNIALETDLGKPFKGEKPLQVRSGKPGTPESEWPEGWRWSPGRIPAAFPEQIPDVEHQGQWWDDGTIEDFYQSTKTLQVKT